MKRHDRKSHLATMLWAALVLLASCAIPATSHAYRLSGAGGKLGYTSPEDLSSLRIPGGSNHYFVEGRLTAGDNSRVALAGGITFHTH